MGRVAVIAGLLLVTLLAYEPLLGAGDVWEDATYAALSADGRLWHVQYGRALTTGSRVLESALFGESPQVAHLVNLFVHLLNGVLVWLVVRRWVSAEAALPAAAVFLVHPLNSEAVSYITGRSDLLLATCVLSVAAVIADRMTLARWIGLALACLAALFTKETGVIALPIALVLLQARTALDWRAWSAAGIVSAYALWRLSAVTWPQSIGHGPLGYLAVQITAVWVYIGLWIAPWGFSIDHDFDRISRVLVVLIAGLTAWGVWVCWSLRRLIPVIWIAVAWLGLTLWPRLLVRSPEYLNERQFYVSAVALALLTGAACEALRRLERQTVDLTSRS